MPFVALTDTLVAFAPRQPVRHLSPKRSGQQAGFEGESIRRVGILSVERRDANHAGRQD